MPKKGLVSSLGPKDTSLIDLKKKLVLYKMYVPKRLSSPLSYINYVESLL